MVDKVVFVAGVHGTGKTTLCGRLKADLDVYHYSASALIKTQRGLTKNLAKIAKDVAANNEALVDAVNALPDSKILMDGHFSLFTKNHNIFLVPEITFEKINISIIILLTCDPHDIVARLKGRDSYIHPIKEFKALQDAEEAHANHVAKLINVPIIKINTSKPIDYESTLNQINKEFI